MTHNRAMVGLGMVEKIQNREVETGIVKMVTLIAQIPFPHAHVQRGLLYNCASTLVYAGACSGVYSITASTPCAMVLYNNLISSNHLSTVCVHVTIAVIHI